jgi:hypothetical protein
MAFYGMPINAPIGNPDDLDPRLFNDPNVKVGQIYHNSDGYFEVTVVSGGFAVIYQYANNTSRTVLRNTFATNMTEGYIRLVTDEVEIAKAMLMRK